MKMRGIPRVIALLLIATLFCAVPVLADVSYLPDVTEDMTDPAYWTSGLENREKILADAEDIRELNSAIMAEPDCHMTDLLQASRYTHPQDLYRELWAGALSDASAMLQSPHYDMENHILTGPELMETIEQIGGENAVFMDMVQYGICVERADITALPTDMIASDEKGNQDFNDLQISSLRVGEPVLIQASTNDGSYLYCLSSAVSGWLSADCIAVCKDREEWLDAWNFPEDEVIVVIGSKIYLEQSNNNPSASNVMLPMGTVLQKVSEEDYDTSVTGRSMYQNYAVWLPIRQEDGSYAKTIALIPENRDVSDGFLPLTSDNILSVAFEKLGDVYGWGGMLQSQDCSGYIRDIYQCFGLNLARNTTWQTVMPVLKYDVSEADEDAKKAVLDTLPPGAILIFKGHEMLYLGHVEEKYYVVSALSGIRDPEGEGLLNVGGVVINTLDTCRMNGTTWLENIHTMLVPYLPSAEGGAIVVRDLESLEQPEPVDPSSQPQETLPEDDSGSILAEYPEDWHFGKTEASVEQQIYPFVKDYGEEEYEQGEVALYYVDGGDIPYVSVTEYMDLLIEVLENCNGREGISYEIFQPFEHLYCVRRSDAESSLLIDTDENTLEFENFNAFTQLADVTASVSVMDLPDPETMDPDEIDSVLEKMRTLPQEEQDAFLMKALSEQYEPESLFATVQDTINRAGESFVLDLSEYLIDIVEQDGECYVPMQTFNDLFMGPVYVSLIFNGEALYCFPYDSALADEVYQAEPEDMSEEFALFNYNELRFLLDCYYGLKEEHGISDFGSLLAQNTDLVSDLVSTNPADFDDAVARLTGIYLDDGHSAFIRPSWRSTEEPNILGYQGFATNNMAQLSMMYSQERAKAFPDGVPMYQEIGDTAFITFDSFISSGDYSEYYHMEEPEDGKFVISTATPYQMLEEYLSENPGDSSEELDADSNGDSSDDMSADSSGEPEVPEPVDTIRLLVYAYKQITREGSPVKNVVLDLSNNGGGNSDAAIYTLVWLLGQANVAIRDTLTGAESIMRLSADLEMTENYNSIGRGLVDQGYRVYCLISPNSFSCGNLVPAACEMSELVRLIGRTSGGGSCAVLPCTSASGTMFQISGPMQLSTVRNGSFYNIDQGIEPDVVLNNIETFYDREGLVELIHNLK